MTTLEHIGDGSVADRNFQKLMSLLPDTGGQSVGIRFGTGTLTFTASASTATATTVNHGLGKTPQAILVLPTLGTEYIVANYISASRDDTSFQVKGQTASSVAITASVSFFWVVIG